VSSDSLQFGIKIGTGCADAMFTLKSLVQYFVDKGSSVFMGLRLPLILARPFDISRVHHFKLYNSLLSAGIPVVIIDVLCNWHSKLSFAVRWNNVISEAFVVGSGVRQKSCLSPAIFNVFL